MDIDSLVGVGTIGRLLRDLKDGSFETDGVVVAYGTLLLKTQGLRDLVQADFSPGGHRVSRGLREHARGGSAPARPALEVGSSLVPFLARGRGGLERPPTIFRFCPWPEGSPPGSASPRVLPIPCPPRWWAVGLLIAPRWSVLCQSKRSSDGRSRPTDTVRVS